MAERRMFAKSIILSDAFLDLPASARCLYFTLNMFADDDGFVGSPKGIMRQCGASEDDMKLLLAKKFLLCFENGVVVIKHWRIHNYIQNDRKKATTYLDEMSLLNVKKDKSYAWADEIKSEECIQNGYKLDTQVRLGKVSIGKNNSRGFTPPTLEEVSEYCAQRKNKVDPQHFIDYYQSQNWKKSNGQKLSDWKAAVRTWEQRDKEKSKDSRFQTFEQRDNSAIADKLEEKWGL